MPLAPVGGWICAESPARNSRPYCIGSRTKLRIGVIPFCSISPSASTRVPPRRARCAHPASSQCPRRARIADKVVRAWPDPAEGIFTVEDSERARRNAGPADAVESVAAADEIAGELLLPAGMPKSDFWRLAAEIVHAHIGHLEQDLATVREPPLDEILDHLLLPINGDTFSHELAKVDVVQRSCEGEMHAIVEHAFAQHARARAGFDQKIARPLLDQSGTNAGFSILAAAILQDDGLDAGEMQQMREHQPRRA